MPTVTRCSQYQEEEQIVFTKKGEWWLIIDSAWVIGEFGLPSDSQHIIHYYHFYYYHYLQMYNYHLAMYILSPQLLYSDSESGSGNTQSSSCRSSQLRAHAPSILHPVFFIPHPLTLLTQPPPYFTLN